MSKFEVMTNEFKKIEIIIKKYNLNINIRYS